MGREMQNLFERAESRAELPGVAVTAWLMLCVRIRADVDAADFEDELACSLARAQPPCPPACLALCVGNAEPAA
jgi:hypothetical protein